MDTAIADKSTINYSHLDVKLMSAELYTGAAGDILEQHMTRWGTFIVPLAGSGTIRREEGCALLERDHIYACPPFSPNLLEFRLITIIIQGGVRMKHEFDSYHIESLHDEWLKSAINHSDRGSGGRMKMPEEWGDGYFRRIQLRPGMELHSMDVSLRENHVFLVDVHYPHLEISFTLDGNGNWTITGSQKECSISSGRGNIIYINETQIRFEQRHSERLTHLELRIDMRLWKQLFTELPWRPHDSFYYRQHTLSPEILKILDQLQNCPYSGQMGQYYMEGKAIELIALCWHGPDQTSQLESRATQLKKADVERLYKAKEILRETQSHPPGLLELARQVGLNDFKLKAGFKELFGTTVFGYIREERMNTARLLLEQGRSNVSETALMVGYTNMSHFSALFRKTYGINPSELVKKKEIL